MSSTITPIRNCLPFVLNEFKYIMMMVPFFWVLSIIRNEVYCIMHLILSSGHQVISVALSKNSDSDVILAFEHSINPACFLNKFDSDELHNSLNSWSLQCKSSIFCALLNTPRSPYKLFFRWSSIMFIWRILGSYTYWCWLSKCKDEWTSCLLMFWHLLSDVETTSKGVSWIFWVCIFWLLCFRYTKISSAALLNNWSALRSIILLTVNKPMKEQ